MAIKTLENVTVSDAYLALMADRGVEYLFANAGTDFAPLIEALAEAPPFLHTAIDDLRVFDVETPAMSDNKAAQRLNDAHTNLFRTVFNRTKSAL